MKLSRKLLLTSTFSLMLLSGCTQYNFKENAMAATESYTEIYTEVAFLEKNTEPEISHEITTQNGPENVSPLNINFDYTNKDIPHTTSSSMEETTQTNTAITNTMGTTKTSSNLSYPDSNYYSITDVYSDVVISSINNKRTQAGLSIATISNTNLNDANIYAANMASMRSFINSNTNNNAHMFICMTTGMSEKSISSSVNKLCSSHSDILTYTDYSIGIAHNENGEVYICIVAE